MHEGEAQAFLVPLEAVLRPRFPVWASLHRPLNKADALGPRPPHCVCAGVLTAPMAVYDGFETVKLSGARQG